jgi:hypothetical protein
VKDPGLNAEQTTRSVADMMNEASDLRKDADKEKERAQILQAQGHTPAAAYHYDRYRDKKKEAESLERQAQQQMLDMKLLADQTAADAAKDKKKVIYYGPDGKPK